MLALRGKWVSYNTDVKSWTAAKRPCRLGVLAAGLMLVLWLVTVALAISPELHRLLHGDAQNVNHQCLVTLVQQHLFLDGGHAVLAPVVSPSALGLAVIVENSRCVARDYRVSPSRAPPALFSPTPVVG